MSCLLLVAVRTSDWNGTDVGRYERTLSLRSDTVDVEGMANDSVEGRESPGNEERRTFTFADVILERDK